MSGNGLECDGQVGLRSVGGYSSIPGGLWKTGTTTSRSLQDERGWRRDGDRKGIPNSAVAPPWLLLSACALHYVTLGVLGCRGLVTSEHREAFARPELIQNRWRGRKEHVRKEVTVLGKV